jgi:hypothetical protein
VIARVETAVGRALPALAELAAPAARIVVGTVYDPSDGTGDTARMGLPPWPDGVATIEALNAALRRVAARHGALVAEIADVFHGHGVVAGNPAQRAARPAERDLWFCNVIEPNAWGAGGVREAFWRALHG